MTRPLCYLSHVGDTIPKFTGRFFNETYSLSGWAQNVEEVTERYGLHPLEQLIIARRSLTSSAALWLRYQRPFRSYELLKDALFDEFLCYEKGVQLDTNIKRKQSELRCEVCEEWRIAQLEADDTRSLCTESSENDANMELEDVINTATDVTIDNGANMNEKSTKKKELTDVKVDNCENVNKQVELVENRGYLDASLIDAGNEDEDEESMKQFECLTCDVEDYVGYTSDSRGQEEEERQISELVVKSEEFDGFVDVQVKDDDQNNNFVFEGDAFMDHPARRVWVRRRRLTEEQMGIRMKDGTVRGRYLECDFTCRVKMKDIILRMCVDYGLMKRWTGNGVIIDDG